MDMFISSVIGAGVVLLMLRPGSISEACYAGLGLGAFCRPLERMFEMDSFLNKIPGSRSSGPGTANTVVGSTAAIVGILSVAAVSTTAPVTGAIIGIAGAGIAAGALYRKLLASPEDPVHTTERSS